MLRTRTFKANTFPIPSGKIFEKLFNLEESLEGQSVSVKSVFNDQDNDPSMIIFYKEDEDMYRFKDFSSGNYGDACDVVVHMYNLKTRNDGFYKILELFENDETVVNKGGFKPSVITKEITDYTLRKWLLLDEHYWAEFGIGGPFLLKYNIKPLKDYTLTITKNGKKEDMVFTHVYCYGYFNKKGELCKIYNPTNTKAKFIKVKDMIQGEDQLKYTGKILIIGSSLKDVGAFQALKFKNIELVVPDSENTKIPKDRIDFYKTKYKFIFTMFDNDVAGMKAMKEYKELYGLPYIYFSIEKDVAECVKQHGVESSRVLIKPLIVNAIQREIKILNKQS